MFGKRVFCLAVACVALNSPAEEGQQRETFGKWRIGVGAAFNSAVRSNLGMRRMPVPSGDGVRGGSTKAAAFARALARRYDGGGYIDTDSLDNGFDTENWELPVSSYRGNGHFVLDNAYEEPVGSSVCARRRDDSDDRHQFGISVEASRELWIHDEIEEHRWGVDFAAAFSYFFARDIYRAHGRVKRTDLFRRGKIRTDVVDPDTTYDYDQGYDYPVGGMYGHGNFERTMNSPALGFAGIGDPYDIGGPAYAAWKTRSYSAKGDYQELEMLFMLRPWYEITDWWRVFAEGGVGVSWGRFGSSFRGMGYAHDEDFAQWDCYGVAGLGTAIRYKRLDIMFDVMGRFLRDDLDVNGRHVGGSVGRADWGLRLMIGYSF